MFVLVLAAEADETRQAITFLIVCLVGIAALLSALTAWYWHHTSPRRQPAAAPGALVAPHREPAIGRSDPQPPPPLVDPGATVDPSTASATGESPAPELVTASMASVALGGPEEIVDPAPGRIDVPDRPAARAPSAVARIEVMDRWPQRSRASAVGATTARNGSGPGPGAVSRSSPDQRVGRPHTGPSGRRNGNGGSVDGPIPGRGDGVDRSDDLLEARQRRRRSSEVLSDEDWAAVMKSAFDKMYQ